MESRELAGCIVGTIVAVLLVLGGIKVIEMFNWCLNHVTINWN